MFRAFHQKPFSVGMNMDKDTRVFSGELKLAPKRGRSSKKKDGFDIEGKEYILPIRGDIPSSIVTSAPTLEYRFLQLTDGDFKPMDSASRKLIRSHVMRNHFQEMKVQLGDLSHANSTSTVSSKDRLKGRWRLAKQPSVRGTKQVNSNDDKSKETSGLSASLSLSEIVDWPAPVKYTGSHTQVKTFHGDGLAHNVPRLEAFQANVRDPFDSMPVATSNPRTNRLMHFYQTEFNINRIAQNPTNSFYGYVVENEGLLHGMLSIVALYMHGHHGLPVKQDILYHRGQAMQIINRDLSDPTKMNMSSLMSSMTSVAVFENLCGNYFNAKAHLVAMRSLIKAAGDVKSLATNDSILRAVAWAEYHYAAATRNLPGYKYSAIECGHPNPLLPEKLLSTAAKHYPYTLELINVYGHTLFSIFRRLRTISIATTSQWTTTRENDLEFRYALSNVMLDTEYDMIALAYDLRLQIATMAAPSLDLVVVCDSICVVGQIFFYAGLRIMPLGTRTVDLYLSRLRPVLYSRSIESWKAQAPMELLLWTLVIAATASNGRAEYLPAMNKLRELCLKMKIVDEKQLLTSLITFPWNEAFHELAKSVLRDVFRGASYLLVSDDVSNTLTETPLDQFNMFQE
ncbi:uncharacterized protein PV09_06596 [Verruconis gallopava]|uniref:Transcription factor domain-containing protein n=1 Tax=Verruconis gallopava TaxID=253628 RepID=A0A0D1XIG7_9PEZI|nr:uncharacterized protein PV09_06596 [Verruconis gallopava]KIW02106.1 hypothetical protein PV09_06596 [Verruconis gallopava]